MRGCLYFRARKTNMILNKQTASLRDALISCVKYSAGERDQYKGSNFYIHLTSICPVACQHCMYSSDLTQKTPKDSFTKTELARVVSFINESQSEKLTISGGGEPFLKMASILRLLAEVEAPHIELVTAGHWAKTQTRAATVLAQLTTAVQRNPHTPTIALRMSVDTFHINAPHGVPLDYAANLIQAWEQTDQSISLGIRSLDLDWDKTDVALAKLLDADLTDINDWNRELILPSGLAIPMTYNVMRMSGAAELLKDHVSPQKDIKSYFKEFEASDGSFTPGTLVNDAINGSYAASKGFSPTLDADGSIWVFCASAPDRHSHLSERSFHDTIAFVMEDPVSRLLVNEGVWRLVEIVTKYDRAHAARVLKMNDITSIVEQLLRPADLRLRVTLEIIEDHAEKGLLTVVNPDLLDLIRRDSLQRAA